MAERFTLSIPKPCRERWDAFKPTDKGGFCASCQKEVIDFTQWSDEEIRQYFNAKSQRACGRFRADQLKTYQPSNNSLKPNRITLPTLAIPLLLAVNATYGQETTIRGTVCESSNNERIPGANIKLKGTDQVTTTDINGQFMLHSNAIQPGDTLEVFFIGYRTQEIALYPNHIPDIEVSLEPDVLGFFDAVYTQPGALRRFWNRVKQVF